MTRKRAHHFIGIPFGNQQASLSFPVFYKKPPLSSRNTYSFVFFYFSPHSAPCPSPLNHTPLSTILGCFCVDYSCCLSVLSIKQRRYSLVYRVRFLFHFISKQQKSSSEAKFVPN